MNANNLFELIHQGFLVTVGASASLVETFQDPQKRATAFSELTKELSERTQEWAEKGKLTEMEARRVIDQLLAEREKQSATTAASSSQTPSTSPTTSTANVELKIKELTQQIIALRTELEMLRKSDSI